MDNEFKRMQELAGLPITENKVEETKETLNENFVGIPAINNIFEHEKTDYEIAFEHFTKGTSLNEEMEDGEDEDYSDYFFDIDTPEEDLDEAKKPGTTKERSAMAKKARAGKELEETLNENFIQGDETVKTQIKTYFEEMAKNYPENLASVLTGLVMGEDPTFEDFVSRVSNDISGDDNPFGLD